jgi:excisionase family DNA binding protein
MADFLKLPEVQARLGCSRGTIYNLIKQGKLTPYYRPARPKLAIFSAAQVESLLTPQLREPA